MNIISNIHPKNAINSVIMAFLCAFSKSPQLINLFSVISNIFLPGFINITYNTMNARVMNITFGSVLPLSSPFFAIKIKGIIKIGKVNAIAYREPGK